MFRLPPSVLQVYLAPLAPPILEKSEFIGVQGSSALRALRGKTISCY